MLLIISFGEIFLLKAIYVFCLQFIACIDIIQLLKLRCCKFRKDFLAFTIM